jgi:membrane fusion protein, multidrug efflux system
MVDGAGVGRLGVLALLEGLLVLVLVGCRRQPDPPPPRAIPVEVVTVETGSMDEVVHAVGSVDAVSSVPVRAQIAGRIERLHFDEGAEVEQDALLVSIDDAELREQASALRASLRSARARAEETASTLARIEPLHEQGIVPEQELDEVRSAAAVAAAEVGRIEAELRALQERRAYTRVRAPFAGRLADSDVNPGDTVQAGDPLVTLVGPGALEVVLWVAQRDAARVEQDMAVHVRLVSEPDRTLPGEIVFVGPQIDPGSRTLLVKAALEDDAVRHLTPGLSASGTIVVDRHTGPVVPERALVGTREGYIAYVVTEGIARARPVEILLREPGRVLLASGIEPGEIVVEYGQQRIADGDRVEIVERDPAVLARHHVGHR